MKKLILSVLLLISGLSSAIAATNIFIPETNTMTLRSVTVAGDKTYSNVVIQLHSFDVLAVGSSSEIENTDGICEKDNFTIDKFNAIQIGMSLDEVTQIIGCESKISIRSAEFISRDLSYVGESLEQRSISVVFDSSSLTVFDRLGSGKTATGF